MVSIQTVVLGQLPDFHCLCVLSYLMPENINNLVIYHYCHISDKNHTSSLQYLLIKLLCSRIYAAHSMQNILETLAVSSIPKKLCPQFRHQF